MIGHRRDETTLDVYAERSFARTRSLLRNIPYLLYAKQVECPVCHAEPGRCCTNTGFFGRYGRNGWHGERILRGKVIAADKRKAGLYARS